MSKHTGSFEAVGSDSETHTVLVFIHYLGARTQTDTHAVVEGLKELRTSDRFAVKRVSKGETKSFKQACLFVLIPRTRHKVVSVPLQLAS